MSSAPRSNVARAAAAALVTLALGGALISCSSDAPEAPAETAAVANPHGDISPNGSPTVTAPAPLIDPATHPANEADAAEITTLVDEYFTTTNAQDADGFRAILCAAVLPEYAHLQNLDPVPDPMRLESVSDIAVDGDLATANLTFAMSAKEGAPSQTDPFKFTREGGQWKVCGSPA